VADSPVARARLPDRLLRVTGQDPPEIAASKARSMRRLVLLTLACEAWDALRFVPYSSRPAAFGVVAAAMTGLAVVGWGGRFAHLALVVAGVLLLGVVVFVFPENANHQFLALVGITLLLLAGEHEDPAAIAALRWIAGIGIFWAGVWKVAYGYWFGAEFLSWRISADPAFAATLGWLLPAPELERIVALGTDVGAGPFRVDTPALIAVSNATWVGELVLPALLLWPRTRAVAVVATIALFVAIELAAREVFFGGMMVGMVLLFTRADSTARALPAIGLVYLAWLLRYDIAGWLA
jgi:hypothetical protein